MLDYFTCLCAMKVILRLGVRSQSGSCYLSLSHVASLSREFQMLGDWELPSKRKIVLWEVRFACGCSVPSHTKRYTSLVRLGIAVSVSSLVVACLRTLRMYATHEFFHDQEFLRHVARTFPRTG